VEWIEKKPLEAWVNGIADKIYTKDQAAKLVQLVEAHPSWQTKEGLEWIYKDNNADHYLDTGDSLVVVDAEIALRPKHYMDMRYLAWTILKMPDEVLNLDWVKKKVEEIGGGEARLTTFLLSLIGILWDIHDNEKHKGEFAEKTDKIKEIVGWVVKELGGKNE
jgi:hypothetical protein